MTGSDVELDALEEKKKKKKKTKKKKGGTKDGKSPSKSGYTLRDWFKGGGWVQTGGKYDGKPCAKQPGQKTKPYCRDPDDRAKLSKKDRDKRARKKRKEDPNPNRKGKAKNVRQKKSKRKNESMELTQEQLQSIISEEVQAYLEELGAIEEKKKKPCKKAKGKRYVKRVNGRCRSFGQAGKAKGGGDRIRPGTKKGDAYCARSAKIKKCKNPPCANDLSRKKWKCRGSKSMK